MKRSGVRRLFSLSLRRDRWASEVEEEILTHLTIRAERLVEQGLSPQAARDEAIRLFGPLTESRRRMIEAATHREQYMRRQETLTELRQDLAFAFRTLSRNKGWSAVAVVTLALGIAATTSVWSAATTVLLHPLSYPQADRLVYVNLMPTRGNSTGVNVSITVMPKLIQAWRSESRTLEAIEPYGTDAASLGNGANAEDITAARVLPSFIRFAGAAPVAGRWFAPGEARKGAGVALLSENFWQTRFARAQSVMGSMITIDKESFRIIGVVPASLTTPVLGGTVPAVWLPIDSSDANRGFRAIARLRPGAQIEQVARELDSITVRSKFYEGNLPFRASVVPPGKTVSFRDSLVMLTGAVMLVLLVAGANVAHLLLARGLTRRRELAIRAALGASRGRLARQMLTETFVLTAGGCLLGAGLGVVALKTLVKFRPPTLPELRLAHVDGLALILVIATSLLCALVFGLIAAAVSSTKKSSGVLRSGAVAAYSRVGERVRSLLVITEMAMSAMLLVGAALLVRTVVSMQHTDLGFDPKNLYVVVPDLSGVKREQRVPAVRQLAEAVNAIPGVQSVTATDALPSYRNFSIGTLEIEGRPRPAGQATSFIDVGSITPSYFRTLGARLVAGRLPADSTGSGSAEEIVINEGYARRQWGDASPIGKRLRIAYQGEDNPWMTIVGVVRDISTMGAVGERGAPFLYTPLRESSSPGIVYRTDGREASVSQVLATAKRMFPNARVRTFDTEHVIDSSLAPSRFIMSLMAGFTVLTLMLAAIGLYGMMSYAVAQRTREIGIRIALGATRDVIARAVVARGALLGSVGAAIGLVLAIWATRILESSLYGVNRLDVASFVVGGLGLVAIAITACLVPTWRAVRVDPMTSIRVD